MAAVPSFLRRGRWIDGFRAEPLQTILVTPLQLAGVGLMSINLLLGGPSSGARHVAAILSALAVGGVLFVNATFKSSEDRPGA